MARGQIAKEQVVQTLATAFGDKYIGEHDKKYYVWADDGGAPVQIAIALTCPKVEIETGNAPDISPTPGITSKVAVELTPEEEDNINTLFTRLGLG